MIKRNLSLAVIFDSYNDMYDFDTVALVSYNPEYDEFDIISGKYSGLSTSEFNILISNGPIFEEKSEINFIEEDKSLKNMYIFDHEKFLNLVKDNDDSIKKTLVETAKKLKNFTLHINRDLSIYTKIDEDSERRINKEELFSNCDFDDLFVEDEEENSIDFGPAELGIIFRAIADALENSNEEENEEQELPEAEIKFIPLDFSSTVHDMDIQRLMLDKKIKDLQKDKKVLEKVKSKKKESDSFKDVNKMIEIISKKIVGQGDAIKTLVSNIIFNQVLIDDVIEKDGNNPSRLDSSKVTILLDGETGTGKTAIEKEIARLMDLPIVITSANSFSETGYVGPTITDILNNLLEQANGNIKRAERGIVVLDEIDKVAIKDNVYGKDMDRGVQEELLSFIGGGVYDVKDGQLFSKATKFDTSKLTFILSGAFTDLREDKIKEEEKKYKPMGFNTLSEVNSRTYTVTPDDYIKFGLMREFFGRIKVLTSTKSYKLEDLKTILLTSEISPLKNFENTVKMFGYKGITFNDEFVEKLATEALSMGTGARSLQTIMSGIQNKMLIGLINQEYDLDKEIELTPNLINEYKKTNIREY
ncbi:MAG: AAA family ATPase [Bacilli bacterium]|nr:AAA family ATPase [Bacilli bacterium]